MVKKNENTDTILSVQKNVQGEELVQREDVDNTPFQIITINNESFGVLGKYRITETFHTKGQCKADLLNMDWNNIVKIMTLVVDIMRENTTSK